MVDRDLDPHRLLSTATANATDGRYGVVVMPNRKSQPAFAGEATVRHIDRLPYTTQPDINPSVCCITGFLISRQITAYITRRKASASAERKHHVGMILTHARISLPSICC